MSRRKSTRNTKKEGAYHSGSRAPGPTSNSAFSRSESAILELQRTVGNRATDAALKGLNAPFTSNVLDNLPDLIEEYVKLRGASPVLIRFVKAYGKIYGPLSALLGARETINNARKILLHGTTLVEELKTAMRIESEAVRVLKRSKELYHLTPLAEIWSAVHAAELEGRTVELARMGWQLGQLSGELRESAHDLEFKSEHLGVVAEGLRVFEQELWKLVPLDAVKERTTAPKSATVALALPKIAVKLKNAANKYARAVTWLRYVQGAIGQFSQISSQSFWRNIRRHIGEKSESGSSPEGHSREAPRDSAE